MKKYKKCLSVMSLSCCQDMHEARIIAQIKSVAFIIIYLVVSSDPDITSALK